MRDSAEETVASLDGQDGQGSPGLQLYLDPSLMQPPPEMRPDFPPSRGTPWFNDRGRR